MTDDISNSGASALQTLRGRLAGRYTVERELGRGGMGAVYLGRDVQLDRLVALKVLPPEFAVQATLRDRFLRETRTAAGFSHPNIVPVYAVEESDDLLAYAMGYVEGESLLERVRRAGPLGVRELVKLMQDVGYALGYAHGRGIVHRDVKPDNIMIERASGRALVMDFGIARAKSLAPVQSEGLTRVGEVVGTPEYMSPEQACGDEVDGRSDLYSLGLTIMFAVTGKHAVQADSTQKILMKQLTEDLPPIATLRGDLPALLSDAIDRCVRKNPSERFETAEGLVDTLDNSQLIQADIPLPIRLFQQDAGGLSLIVAAFLFAALYIVQSVSATGGDEQLLLVVMMLGVLATRVSQTLGEARRLAIAGFAPSDIMSGMQRVMDEREQRRKKIRADASTRGARKRSIMIGVGLLVLAAVSFRIALTFRHEIRPNAFHVEPWGALFIVLCMASVGVAFVLLLKSPLRMPVGERLFRFVWLGRFGRAFVRLGGRRHWVRRGADAPLSTAIAVTRPYGSSPERAVLPAVAAAGLPVLAAGSAVSVDTRLNAVEDRLAELERAFQGAFRGSETLKKSDSFQGVRDAEKI